MRNKVLEILLTLVIFFAIFMIFATTITINKYTKIANTIDKKIDNTQIKIKEKEEQLKKYTEANKIQKDELDASEKNISTLKEEIKKYEK